MGKNNDDTFMTNPDEWWHMNMMHPLFHPAYENEKPVLENGPGGPRVKFPPRHKDATVKSDAEAINKWFHDPDNIGTLLDPVVVVGAGYRCSQLAIDWAEGHTDQEAVHGGECTADEIMSLVTIASGGTAMPEAEVVMEETNAGLTTAKEVVKETAAIPKFMGPGGVLVVAATPAVINVLTKRQKAEEAKKKAEGRKKDDDLWNDYLDADIVKLAFDEQGVWDVDYRPKLVPDIVQPAQEEDEPVLAHEVVEPTVEPDLQPSVSAPSAPQPANLQTTGAVLVLTSVIIYAAYSTYVSA